MGEKKKKNNKPTKRVKTEKTKRTKSNKSKKENKEAMVNKKGTKLKFKHKHPKLSIFLKILLILFLLLCVIGAGIVMGLIYGPWADELKIDVSQIVMTENSIIVDSEGTVLAELNGSESRKIITLDEMSPYLPKAFIAIEDTRFYEHHGVDLKRTGKAVLSFITHFGKSTEGGGSTITQQLVKNVTQDKAARGINGVIRKLKEWAKAYQVEDELSKNQILEIYLNLILMGKTSYGVEAGAEYYFNTTAKDLSIAQCAFLAGINNAPNSYNPYSGNDVTEKITKRTKIVLGQMKKTGAINQEEYDAAVAEVEAGFKFENGVKGNVYSSHTDALLKQLTTQIMEEKNISESAAETYLKTSGLKIYSTQVASIQSVMEEEMAKPNYVIHTKDDKDNTIYSQSGAVIIDPKTGYVVGAVGQLGEKTVSRGTNRAILPRQTGSSIKPLSSCVPGIEEGIITPATIYADSRTTFGKTYSPENYNDFTGLRTIRSALTTSQNIPFLKVVTELTPKKSMEYLKRMGVSSLDDEADNNIAAVAIGGFTYGISPLEMAGAYATIANDGVYIEPTFYTKAVDANGNTVLEPSQKTERACSIETAYMVKNLMLSVVNDSGGTARFCKINGIDVAAKTGTTNETKDRWLCGFTNYYSCAVWYGYDTPARIKISSSKSSGLIWANIMKEIHKGLEDSTFERPEGIVSATVCRTSGRLASDKCTNTYSEVFVKGHLPETCDAHQGSYTICADNGLLANEYCPNKQTKETGYIVEKERLGLWKTPSASSSEDAPTNTCTTHKKPVEVKPTQPTQSTQPTQQTKPTQSTQPTQQTKPTQSTQTTQSTQSTQSTQPTQSTQSTQQTTQPTQSTN